MGFQPEGDLPEGIIIPPPVEGNCTDCTYDYDYPDLTEQEESSRGVVNRARTSASDQTRGAGTSNQSRGQQLSQPITPAPLPRRVQASPARPAAPAFQAAAPAFQPTPIPARPAPVRQEPEQTPQRNFNANRSRSRGSSRGASSPSRSAQPTRTRDQSPIRIAAPSKPSPQRSQPSAPRSQPSPPRSQSSLGGFANFPARDDNSAPSRQAPQRQAPQRQAPQRQAPQRQAPQRQAPVRQTKSRPAPEPQRNSAPQQPSFRQPEQPRNTVPSFQNFAPQQNIQPAFASRPAPPPSRPAITFQDPNPAPAQSFQQGPAPPANLPKSALEVVDFNQLLKEFQGRPSQPRSNPQRFAPAPQQPSFAAQPAVPGVFQSANFPVRF